MPSGSQWLQLGQLLMVLGGTASGGKTVADIGGLSRLHSIGRAAGAHDSWAGRAGANLWFLIAAGSSNLALCLLPSPLLSICLRR